MSFSSTLLPQNETARENQKAILDLLAKINALAGGALDDDTILIVKLKATQSNIVFGRKSAGAGPGEEIQLGNSISYLSGLLDTIQDIRITAIPQFAGLLATGTIRIDSVPDSAGFVLATALNSTRWVLRTSNTETGADVGSDFAFVSRHDDGSAKGTPLLIQRSTGFIGINQVSPRSLLELRGGAQYFSDPNVSHGMANYYPTDVFGAASIFDALGGGFLLIGLTDTVDIPGIAISGLVAAGSTAASVAAVRLLGGKKSGTGAVALGAAEKLLTLDMPGVNDLFTILGSGNTGRGIAAPTARFHIQGGTATAGTAPLKVDSGTLLGTTEAGAIENDGTHLYYTPVSAGTRYQLDQQPGTTYSDVTANGPSGLMSGSDKAKLDKLKTRLPAFLATSGRERFLARINKHDFRRSFL